MLVCVKTDGDRRESVALDAYVLDACIVVVELCMCVCVYVCMYVCMYVRW